jgi:hypothetical protein
VDLPIHHPILILSPLKWLLKEYVIGYQDAHRCTKNQAYSRKFGSFMWSKIAFMSTMHLSNVGSNAHIDQICSVVGCIYLWIPSDALILVKVKLYWLYVNLFCKYDDSTFNEFIVVYEHYSELLPLTWASHEPSRLVLCVAILSVQHVGQNYGLHHHGESINVYVHVNLVNQTTMFETMKVACLEVALNLCFELSHRFLHVEIMTTFGIV